jgi:hypothetical protein
MQQTKLFTQKMHDTSAELMYHIDGEKIGFGE